MRNFFVFISHIVVKNADPKSKKLKKRLNWSWRSFLIVSHSSLVWSQEEWENHSKDMYSIQFWCAISNAVGIMCQDLITMEILRIEFSHKWASCFSRNWSDRKILTVWSNRIKIQSTSNFRSSFYRVVSYDLNSNLIKIHQIQIEILRELCEPDSFMNDPLGWL